MISLFRLLVLVMMVACMPYAADFAMAASGLSTQEKIERIKQERKKLAAVKRKLEGQLGAIGKELRGLDSALIAARKLTRSARAKVRETDRRLAVLKKKSKDLQKQIASLKQAMLNQAAAAWKRSSRASEWLGVFTGVPVSDIPHRRYLLNQVMRSQSDDRHLYIEAIAELAQVEAGLQQQRAALELLRLEKKKAEVKLASRVGDKRTMMNRVRKKVRSQKGKERRLAREEKALLGMLNEMSQDDLLALAEPVGTTQQKVRKRKGRLKWPIRARITASFHSRPRAGMPRLKGVQLRPKSSVKEVSAMAAGQVRYADWFGGYGLMTIVDYGDGVLGVYAHNDVLYKQLGDWVEEGEIIADVGSTGWVNKVTLYFEIRDRGKAVNPKRWCRR